jgi:hypothetical protein
MHSLANRPPGSPAFNAAQSGLTPQTKIYTCEKGKWRQYDGDTLSAPDLVFFKYESISIVTAKNNGQYLDVRYSTDSETFAVRQRCDGSSSKGLLQLTATKFVEGILGQYRMHGRLTEVCGYLHANLGTKLGPSGHAGSFINVIDMTNGHPAEVPKVILDRQLETGEFASAVEMLSNALYS